MNLVYCEYRIFAQVVGKWGTIFVGNINMKGKNNTGRNDPCPCGSGKKFKHCCLESERLTSPRIGGVDLCSTIEYGLKNINKLTKGAVENYNIKSVTFIGGQTICCQYYTRRLESQDIKVEMFPIMTFISALVKDNGQVSTNIHNVAVRAFNGSDEEIMYAISELGNIDENKRIEWLNNTHFQVNTDEFRLQVAKQQTSSIENALRKTVSSVLEDDSGSSWWTVCVTQKIRDSAEKMYESKYGVKSTDGKLLLEFTFLTHLKKIIINNWSSFSRVFTAVNQNQFGEMLDKLNEIRKDEAHNRTISDEVLKDLNQIYNALLGPIATVFPDLVPKYLVDNWHHQLKEQVGNHPVNQHFKNYKVTREVNANAAFIVKAIEGLVDLEAKLKGITAPPGKIALHNDIFNGYHNVRVTYERMIKHYNDGNIDELEKAGKDNSIALKALRNLRERILLSEG